MYVSDAIAITPTVTGGLSAAALMVTNLSWDWVAAVSLTVSLITMIGVTAYIKHKRDRQTVFTVNNFIIK